MPTAPSEVNNAIDLLGFGHEINANGRRQNDARYKEWRKACADYVTQKGWHKKSNAGSANWAGFTFFAREHQRFPAGARNMIFVNRSDPHITALDKLLQDVVKKYRESVTKKRSAAQRQDIEEENELEAVLDPMVGPSDGGRPKRARFEEGKAAFIYILDPNDDTHKITVSAANTPTKWL